MEWIFLVTKPSFMSSLNRIDQFGIFFKTASLVSIFYLLFISLYLFLERYINGFLKKIIIFGEVLIPGLLMASLMLLLIDNFTYTILQFGIITSAGITRGVYGVFFVFLVFISINEVSKLMDLFDKVQNKLYRKQKNLFIILLLIILFIFGTTPIINNLLTKNSLVSNLPLDKSPHIFLITADGINAENMSLYGYERETTPFIDQLAEESLVAENAFTNSANTAGSIISILTGKHPIETKVLYPPDILKSEDAYQHLPAILKLNGYATNQLSVGHYVDAYQLNMINGFDEVNGRSNQNDVLVKVNQFLPDDIGFFLYDVGNRIVDRIRHIFYLKQMKNPIVEVSNPNNYKDNTKLDSALNFLDESTKPVFTHIHWMGTHGAKFNPSKQVFSAGQDPKLQNDWELDFYDDSILDFDQSMKIFYSELDARGLINESIIIIASDHGQKYVTNERLPLIIRFPNGENHKSITSNIQNLDVAPTIIDYLGLIKPTWMVGDSLLDKLPENRYIFAVGVTKAESKDEGWVISESAMQPPFYQFGYVSIIYCDTWYKLNLETFSWNEQKISGHVGNCPDQIKSKYQVLKEIIQFFDTYNYDTTSIINLLE
jgi:arylsulfatase A-like enzyme